MRKRFCDLLSESVNKRKDNNFYLTTESYNSLLSEVEEAKSVKGKQTVHYGLLKRYDILNIGGEGVIICRKNRNPLLCYI